MTILADSCCDLSPELLKKTQAKIAPLTITIDDTHYVDDGTVDIPPYLAAMKASKNPVRSACPSPDLYAEDIRATEGDCFIVTLSAKLSGSHNAASLGVQLAQEDMPEKKVHVFDSESASAGETYIALMIHDLIAAGKSRDVTFSSAGSGSPGHLAVELFKEATGMKITQVPYNGNSPAVAAVLSGEVNAGVLATPGMLPHVKAGKITALAVTSRQRSPLAPSVPTVAEAGYKNLEQEVLYVAMVPAATPDAVVQTLQKGFADALAQPQVKQRLLDLDLVHEGLTGAAASKRLADLSARYERVIRATGMHVE